MASTFINNFGFESFPTITPVWRWENTDDAGLVAYMEANSSENQGDFAVDRSSAAPVLRWQIYDSGSPTGQYDSLNLVVGDYIDPMVPPVNPLAGDVYEPGVRDMTGWWECDQYGRPYDLNDLLA